MKVVRLTESDVERLVRKIIKEESNQLHIKDRNFTYQVGDRKSAYLTGDLGDMEVNQVLRSASTGLPPYYSFSVNIPLFDFHTYKPVGSWLRYNYNTKTNEGRLWFKYNYTEWEDVFKVIPSNFHGTFKQMMNSLEGLAKEKIQEKEEQDKPKPEPKKKRFGLF